MLRAHVVVVCAHDEYESRNRWRSQVVKEDGVSMNDNLHMRSC